MLLSKQELARYIDQTNLKAGVTPREIRAFCEDAAQHRFASVCALPYLMPACAEVLAGSDTKCCTVISFPLGDAPAAQALFETEDAIAGGAQELDLVLNLHDALQDPDAAFASVADVAALVHKCGLILKLIIETPLLGSAQIAQFARCGERAGADFIKTSTGFAPVLPRSTTVEDVRIIRANIAAQTGLKAAGGIRTAQDALAMIEAGATRIGASSGANIIAEIPE